MSAKLQLLAYSALMGLIIFSAYAGWIPVRLHCFPFFDLVGHFVLYGFWGYFSGKAFPRPIFSFGRFKLQFGIAAISLVAITEEFLQQLSPMRSFSIADLGFGLFGIAVACTVLNFKRN